MVFAPVPVLTITMERPGEADELHLHAGSQGIWEARMLTVLGVPVTVCATLGGETGDVLEHLIKLERMNLRAVHRQSDAGWYVHDRRTGDRSEIADSPGAPLTRHELDELYGLALVEGLRAGVSVLSGPMHPSVVPPEIYRRLAADLSANGARVVADLSGEHLAAVLDGGVHFLKVSHEELLADGRAADDTVPELVAALRRLRAEGAESVLISRAGEPALALLEDEVFEVSAPTLRVAEHRGAGDSMTAGVAAVLARGGDLREAVRTGAAAGAVNITRHGLGTGQAELIAEMAARVRLCPYQG
ncbi:MAG TPA: PfkB family carbohydrate kinase [Pilimelia sp.]|nr:PfkB family carbohydrate kinase [Pilimelia sp.]